MLVSQQISIHSTKAAVWATITDIARSAVFISNITKIEILESPPQLVGLKWNETRILFGKPATVAKCITEAIDHVSYTTRAEDGGFVFMTTLRIEETPEGVTLISSHDSRPQTFLAKVMTIPMKFFFQGTIKKAIMQDLIDIKNAIENTPRVG